MTRQHHQRTVVAQIVKRIPPDRCLRRPSRAAGEQAESRERSDFDCHRTRRANHLPALVDIVAVAKALGISMRQVRRFVADGQIPFVRVGHLIRFDPDELNDWINARRAGSTQSL